MRQLCLRTGASSCIGLRQLKNWKMTTQIEYLVLVIRDKERAFDFRKNRHHIKVQSCSREIKRYSSRNIGAETFASTWFSLPIASEGWWDAA